MVTWIAGFCCYSEYKINVQQKNGRGDGQDEGGRPLFWIESWMILHSDEKPTVWGKGSL